MTNQPVNGVAASELREESPTASRSSGTNFASWLQGKKLTESLAIAESDVRANPTDANIRWLLFEILCLLGHWQRALKVVQTCVQLDKALTTQAQLMRKLILNEVERTEVLTGKRNPGWVIEPPVWVENLLSAVKLEAKEEQSAADTFREKAMADAPECPVTTNLGTFDWLSDTDSRFGPVCEIVVSGHYCWLPFSDISEIHLSAPHTIIDLIWRPARVILIDATELSTFIHSRYNLHGEIKDNLLLGRETVWRDIGRTAVIGSGQKSWMHDKGEFGILDLRECFFVSK